MQTYRERLQESARELAAQYDTMKSEAERRLGTLFNASDYPTTLDGLFDLEVTYPAIEPPAYLVSLHPDVYQQEQALDFEQIQASFGGWWVRSWRPPAITESRPSANHTARFHRESAASLGSPFLSDSPGAGTPRSRQIFFTRLSGISR
jgi:hypothetical protein